MADIPAEKRATIAQSYVEYLPAEPEPEPEKPKKKKKLTKAEKKALKLQRALDFAKLEKRAHLKRELELSKRSALRGQESWEEMCTEIKLLELKEELMEWNASTQRVLNKKDEQIKMLLEDMENTQEMHRRQFTKSIQIINHTMETYKTILKTIRNLYCECSSEYIQEFYEELKAKKDIQDGFRDNLNNVMHATNLFVERQLKDDYEIYLLRQDDVVNTEIEKRYQYRDSVVAKMQALQKQLTDFVYSLKNASLDVHKYERINMLMEKQRNFYVESQKLDGIEHQNKYILTSLQRDLLQVELDKQRKFNDLHLEQAYFVQVRKNIERNIEMDRKITFDKLRILCSESYDMGNKFKSMERMGELLLCLSANCRKLQTEAEKVQMFGEFERFRLPVDDKDAQFNITVDEKEYFQLKVLDLKEHLDLSEEELLQQMMTMQPFWYRQSIVEAQTILLRKDKQELVIDNEKYIDFIRSMTKLDSYDELPETIKVTCLLEESQMPCETQGYQLKQPKHR